MQTARIALNAFLKSKPCCSYSSLSYKSAISLDNLYPTSSLKLTTPSKVSKWLLFICIL